MFVVILHKVVKLQNCNICYFEITNSLVELSKLLLNCGEKFEMRGIIVAIKVSSESRSLSGFFSVWNFTVP